jgi:2'-hydroxyisoflavone reductase
MRILVIGGTVFLGRHLVEAAQFRGHDVTLFNRGKTNPGLFPGTEMLQGDRSRSLAALENRCWDAAIDTCGYVPRVVSMAANRLKSQVGHYTFISSISVYADRAPPGPGESSPLGKIADESTEEITGETYGPLKALCERAVESAMPCHVLTVRPGLIAGPHDPTDRLTYWPVRVARGGEVLAPGRPDAPTQVIDVRDLAAWIIGMIERGKTGIYNATGPAAPLTLGELLDACRGVVESNAAFNWMDEEFLRERGVAPFSELPCWVPNAAAGMLMAKIERALADGLACRPLDETLRDILAWRAPSLDEHPLKAGLSPEREAELLAAWRARSG